MRLLSHLLAVALLTAGCSGTIGDLPGGGAGGGGGGGSGPGSGSGSGSGQPGQPTLFGATTFRLTGEQYRNTIRDIFGAGIDTSDIALEPDEATELFSTIGAAKVATSSRGVEQYRDAALKLAERIFAAPSGLADSCRPSKATDSCVNAFVEHYGRLLFRRPLSSAELTRYHALIGSQGGDPATLRLGMKFVMAALLMSPSFLYVPQVGQLDAQNNLMKLGPYELASRLSYLIWNSTPDAALLAAAEAGELDTAAGVHAEARRLLDDERARGLSSRFFAEAFKVDKLALPDKKAAMFSDWNAELLAAYRGEFNRVIEDIAFTRDVDIRQIFDSNQTFVNATLAKAYGLPDPGGQGYVQVTVDDRRAGVLTSGAVIAANSPSDRTSPTHRGLLVLERILCVDVPPPPPNVNEQALDGTSTAGMTLRERLERHRTDPACAGCHAMFDPAGFTFEHYDAIGLYRTLDQGKPVDSRGELDGRTFNSVKQLADYLKSEPRTSSCIVKRLYSFATGHQATVGETPLVDGLAGAFAQAGHRFKALVAAIVASEGFRYYRRESN